MKQTEIDEERAERMMNAKIGMVEAFQNCEITLPEGLTVLTSMLIQLYDDLYPRDTKEDFLEAMEQVHDAYTQIKMLIESEPTTIQ